jgi:hypothetical protein
VDPDARSVPWAIAHGTVTRVLPGRSIALAVNGRIAGLALVDKKREYHALLAPKLFVRGTNTITPYLVGGKPNLPKLFPLQGAQVASSAKG